jgi:hypothetical protein
MPGVESSIRRHFLRHVVGLSQRGGRHGHRIDRMEQSRDRLAQLLFERGLNPINDSGGTSSCRLRLVDDLFRQNIHATADGGPV